MSDSLLPQQETDEERKERIKKVTKPFLNRLSSIGIQDPADELDDISIESLSEVSALHGRALARSQAFQLLYQAQAAGRSVENVLAGDYALSDGPLKPYGEQLALGCDSKLQELDTMLDNAAHNWSVDRMSSTERNLLRIALYEILYVDDVETGVAINECVELAKIYCSSDDSSRFVNGILGRVVEDLQKAGQ